MKATTMLVGLLILGSAFAAGAQKNENAGLTVHEWGTFLTMSGSDGVSLDGMYHEEHALPGFVHARSKDQLRLHSAIVKGETPVIYFYTKRPMTENVRVDFPGGIWTQWYPQAALAGPPQEGSGSPPRLTGGHIQWTVDLIPSGSAHADLPQPGRDALWNYARDVDAAIVQAKDYTRKAPADEAERFIFYRGLGRAPLPLESSAISGGSLTLSASMQSPLKHIVVLRVENGRGAFRVVDSLRPGATVHDVIPSMDGARPLEEFTKTVGDELARRLEEDGLFAKEARAMVNTWTASYFHSDGIRVLYVLPQSWTDAFIPMRLDPKPERLVRVMVGRTEMLTPEREARMSTAIRDLASAEEETRERAFAFLRDQGRYAEPILRREQRTGRDERLQMLCSRLLLTGFVNDLRTATVSAENGERVVEKAPFVHAQLASLLREIGLDREAKAEGERALRELEAMPMPPLTESTARRHLRGYSRAAEGIGDDRAALGWYGKFIQFGSQTQKCANCHSEEGPKNMAFYRDWWAGRRYAAAAARLGETQKLIEEKRQTVRDNPGDTASQMMLAYLCESRGDTAEASSLWASISRLPVRSASIAVRAAENGAEERPVRRADVAGQSRDYGKRR